MRFLDYSRGSQHTLVVMGGRSGPRTPSARARREQLIAVRDSLSADARRHGVSNVAVVGSVARGDARSDSDVDFLIDASPETSLLDLAQLRKRFERALGTRVHLIDRESLEFGLDHLEREAIPLSSLTPS